MANTPMKGCIRVMTGWAAVLSVPVLLTLAACGGETAPPTAAPTPTPTAEPEPTVAATTAPTPTVEAAATPGWILPDGADGLSIRLDAYETGDGQGAARLTVTCFNSPPLGQYISADIAWDSPVSVLYDLDVQLTWDDQDTVLETWDGTTLGNNVTPRRKGLDQEFIDRLLEYGYLEFAVEGDEGRHDAKFHLQGFEAVYVPFKADCESRPTPGTDYLDPAE